MIQASQSIEKIVNGSIGILGVPFDDASSFMRGPAQGPPRIREVLHNGSSNWFTESGVNLEDHHRLVDLGDLAMNPAAEIRRQITEAVSEVLNRGGKVLSLGGDHSITYPLVKAYAGFYAGLQILHFDAHCDLYNELLGDRYSHACPFARIMEEGLAARLVQVGIRTLNDHQRAQADRFGVEVFEMKDWSADRLPEFTGPVYLSFDMDVLDPAFAPGVSHHEPGGFSTREVINLLHQLKADLVGADIVELNPLRDPQGITAAAAGRLFKEIAGRMLETGGARG